ncbi:hypothetical protein [Streptomyces sp. CC228A]|uniref:hypothetical protein n=1 Tax=Streptomyces sp. CC228A TaxID=2898186 RepID=UPI001F46520B|nr:hypothetical protein [Streptomyces sp. CC228A]
MIRKALACTALVAAAMALGTAPASATDENGGSFHSGEYGATHMHYLESAGGAVIFGADTHEGSYMGANW